jgi:hypothetical protein
MTQYKYDETMKFRFTKNEHNEFHSFDDKPSFEYLDSSIISWHKNGLLHRLDKPALIRTLINGTKLEEYYNDGIYNIPNIKTQLFIHDNNSIKSNEDSLIIVNETEDKLLDENMYNFNKQIYVPDFLCNYIGIKSNEKKSRPEVTKLLNHKFKEDGLIKIRKDDNNKEIKVIILDKTTAKKLCRKEGHEIFCKDIQ